MVLDLVDARQLIGHDRRCITRTRKPAAGQILVLIDADVMHARCYDAAGSRSTAGLAGLTVIVADDADDSRALLATLLESRGARVLTARNALEALILMAASPRVDALVTDLAMPQMDGVELARKLRGDAHGRLLPVVAVTGLARHYADGEQAGFEAIPSKPIDLDRLCGALRTLARRESRGRARTRSSSTGRPGRPA
jgi:CheY-like chemotaxis protein